jgi:DNA replication protein DnaC
MSTATTSPPKKSTEPKVDLDATRERMIRLGFLHAADQLEPRLTEAVKNGASPHRMLDQLLDEELVWREERRIRTGLKLSGLPQGQTLGSFDFGFQPAVDRSQIETLGTCSWIRERYNLLLQGPPGVGKTHLAVALGVRAIENGFSIGCCSGR